MKNGQRTLNVIGGFFFVKLNEKSKENQERNVLYIRGYEVTYVEFKTDLNAKNFVQGFFSIKSRKNVVKTRVKFWTEVPFKNGKNVRKASLKQNLLATV